MRRATSSRGTASSGTILTGTAFESMMVKDGTDCRFEAGTLPMRFG
jgi:hypothetical protein